MLNCVTNCVTANIYPMAVQISGMSNMGFQIKFLVVINQDLSGSNIFHPVFWPKVKYQDVKSNKLEKIIYLVIDLLHNLFMMLKNEGENLKYSLLQTHIFICITYRLDSKNNPPEAARVATSIKFFNVEKT